jgi:hypothetical protein
LRASFAKKKPFGGVVPPGRWMTRWFTVAIMP